jgi:tape measure domain-containing protein
VATKDAKLKIIVDAQDNTRGTFNKINSDLGSFKGSIGGAGAAALGFAGAAAAAVAAVGGYGVKIAAELQTAEVGLTTLLGSADAARATVDRLKREASRTPFELPGLTQATQLLTSVTKDGNRSIDIILDIGEALAAMGKGQAELDRITVNLQQIAATGRAATIDIKQFAFSGIPIYEMLAETTGKNGEALASFIEEGGVTFDLLTKMFDQANDEGGRFFNAFVNQSGTFNQALSNLKDSFGIFVADIVKNTGLFDGLTRAMMAGAGILQNYEQFLTAVKTRLMELAFELDKHTGLVTLLSDVWSNIVFVFNEQLKPALDELWITLQPYAPFLEALGQVIGTALVIAVGALVMILGTLAITLIEVLTVAAKVADFFYGAFADAWDFITDRMAEALEVVKNVVNMMERAVSLVRDLPGKAGKAIGSVFKVDDAIIAPNGNIISTHPDDYLIATKDPHSLTRGGNGGGMTININGGTYLSEDAAERLGDLIMGRLKLSNAM